MTDEEIQALSAGRDLDAALFEDIFGAQWLRSSATGNRALFVLGRAPEWFKEPADLTERLATDWDWHVPYFSSDIAAAWQVIKQVGKLGLSQQFADCFPEVTPWHWSFLSTEAFCLSACHAALMAHWRMK